MSRSKLSRLELAEGTPRVRDVEALLALYRATDEERRTLLALVSAARQRDWWHPYADALPPQFRPLVGLEDIAARIRTFESQLVPGLLQTEDYARAVINTALDTQPEDLEHRVAVRMERQKILHKDDPPHISG